MRVISHFRFRRVDSVGRHAREGGDPEEQSPQADTPLYRQAIECSPIPILVMGADAHAQPIVYANPAFESLLGYGWQEVVGRDWRNFLSDQTCAERAPPAPVASVHTCSPVEETRVALRRDGTLLHLKVRRSGMSGQPGSGAKQVAVLYDVTVEHRIRETLEYRACHDPLTGLANRYLLRDRFEHAAAQAQRHGTVCSVALLDLDDFKKINDRFGHAAGDEALTFFGARLREAVRSEDTAARLGGDEFVLLLMEADPESIRLVMRRIRGALAAFRPLGPQALNLSCSAGIAHYPDDGTTLEALLEAADKRLYAAKA